MDSTLPESSAPSNFSTHSIAINHQAIEDGKRDVPAKPVHKAFVCFHAEFELENDLSLVFPLTEKILEMVTFAYGDHDEFIRMKLAISLEEAVSNAILHGNLEVSSALREQESAYRELIEQRLLESPYSNRRTFVAVTLNRHQLSFVIDDQGPGFQVSLIPDPTAEENLEKVSGRGLALMRNFMDMVTHNEQGNMVTMLKNAPV